MQDTGLLNEKVAKTIIKELIHQGVRTFFIAPGSRSAALVTAAAEHPLVKTHVHFDERALGFMALGYAKAKKTPAALILTSGTAVANVLPSVIEASKTNVPMIILSADRPPELLDCGANQTIDQPGIFGSYTRHTLNFPVTSSDLDLNFYSSSIGSAVSFAKDGPVHINCPFRKPFLGYEDAEHTRPYTIEKKQNHMHTTYFQGDITPHENDLILLAERLSGIENGIILVGDTSEDIDVESLETLSRLLQWPILADITSNLRSKGPILGLARYYDLILGSLPLHETLPVEGVLHLGGPVITKRVHDWLLKHKPSTYCHVRSNPSRAEHLHLANHHMICSPNAFLGSVFHHINGRGPTSWMGLWNSLGTVVENRLGEFFDGTLNEMSTLNLLNELPDNVQTFIGNSMPIRDADSFFFPKTKSGSIFANRGTSGIDGNIATAIGICKALSSPTLAIIGDQTLLHDIGSLAALKNLDEPFILLNINNGGGGIFSFLPIAKKQNIFETYFANAESRSFKGLAHSFGLTYNNPDSIDSLKQALTDGLSHPGPTLIEVCTNRAENVDLHKKLISELSGLNLSPKSVPFPAYAKT